MFTIKINEINDSRLLKSSNNGYFQQTPFWGEFKSRHNWKNMRFALKIEYPEDEDEKDCHHNHEAKPVETLHETELSVLTRTFARGFFTVAYIPLFPQLPYRCTDEKTLDLIFNGDEKGAGNDLENEPSNPDEIILSESPVTPETQTIEFVHLLNDIAKALKPYLPSNTICIRFDPAVEFSSPDLRDCYVQGMKMVAFADKIHLKKNRVDIQPPDSTQISLIGDETEILNSMKSKWRYNIRLAEKKGVLIEKIDGNDEDLSEKLNEFYSLYKITAERDGIGIHPKSYYADLLNLSAKKIAEGQDVPKVTLYLAKHDGDYLGAIITLFSKTEGIYLYGCSGNKKRNLMPNFLLQWTAMKDAKEYGCAYYDMYGMPPTDDERHPMHGLYLFKTGFGGKNIHRIGSWDISLSPLYGFYAAAENVRAFWAKKVKKIRR